MNKSPEVEAFYSSYTWRRCRKTFLASKGGLCESCLAKGLITPAVHVHHKVRLTAETVHDPAVALSWDNLMALCEDCHQSQHNTRRWRCGPDGRIEIRR